ncbi:Uroporphyrinogen-III synthase [Candidatus Moranella endobia PCVAL]|uniref:Uroporphyrinogen-III synthase n=1 Tax=Moranella endobia (strain PCIT) TaxID=903503 RepID=F7XX67_MOREP|nr:uroporphyrinogen-III synthase [Candidatus Moranella endobia]AEI74693.1 uroporphyrinogen-III synthase [Candidatus Moranella endobia PCIT]AGJ61349.1 Uroporphyrinogen-III synthase [Candidatus Moranella endobia PCVAL]
MTILVTRPSPAGKQLVNRLRTSGKCAWHLPLIHFNPGKDLPHLPQHLANLTSGDLLFIVSQNAINYAHPWLKQHEINWPDSLHYYAIGPSTGLLLHGLSGLLVSYPETGSTSEDVLSLPTLAGIDGKRALILRGNGGSEVLEQMLLQRGVQTTYCECYRRSPIYYDGEEQSHRMQTLGIDTLVITSGEMLQQFYQLIPEYYRCTWLKKCKIIVVSTRLAMIACKLGWTNIIVAKAADNDTLMRTLL